MKTIGEKITDVIIKQDLVSYNDGVFIWKKETHKRLNILVSRIVVDFLNDMVCELDGNKSSKELIKKEK